MHGGIPVTTEHASRHFSVLANVYKTCVTNRGRNLMNAHMTFLVYLMQRTFTFVQRGQTSGGQLLCNNKPIPSIYFRNATLPVSANLTHCSFESVSNHTHHVSACWQLPHNGFVYADAKLNSHKTCAVSVKLNIAQPSS